MRPMHVLVDALVSLAIGAATVSAQPSDATTRPARRELSATLGTLYGSEPDLNQIYSGFIAPYGGAHVGFYWTEHWKTEVEVGISAERTVYGGAYDPASDASGYMVMSEPRYDHRFRVRTISLAQHYQFFRNAWLHPNIGVGVATTWERETRYLRDFGAYEVANPGLPAETRVRPNAFVAAGFKAYMTRHTFFRSDLKLTTRHSIDHALLRFGLGVDF